MDSQPVPHPTWRQLGIIVGVSFLAFLCATIAKGDALYGLIYAFFAFLAGLFAWARLRRN